MGPWAPAPRRRRAAAAGGGSCLPRRGARACKPNSALLDSPVGRRGGAGSEISPPGGAGLAGGSQAVLRSVRRLRCAAATLCKRARSPPEACQPQAAQHGAGPCRQAQWALRLARKHSSCCSCSPADSPGSPAAGLAVAFLRAQPCLRKPPLAGPMAKTGWKRVSRAARGRQLHDQSSQHTHSPRGRPGRRHHLLVPRCSVPPSPRCSELRSQVLAAAEPKVGLVNLAGWIVHLRPP